MGQYTNIYWKKWYEVGFVLSITNVLSILTSSSFSDGYVGILKNKLDIKWRAKFLIKLYGLFIYREREIEAIIYTGNCETKKIIK